MSFILIYFMQTCIKPGVFLLKEMTNADFLIKYLRIKLVNLELSRPPGCIIKHHPGRGRHP